MVSLNLSSVTRWGLNLLALLGVVVALHFGQTIFIPTIIALLLAAILWPAVRWLNRVLHCSWGFSCMVGITGLVLLNLLITLGFSVALTKLLQELPRPDRTAAHEEVYRKVRNRVEMISPVPIDDVLPPKPEDSGLFNYIQQTLKGEYVTRALLDVAYYANLWLWQWVLVMFLLFFMLLDGPMLTRRVVEIFGPSQEARSQAVLALSDMARDVRTFLVWRTIINFALAGLVGCIYHWIGLRQPWTWAMLTAVLCYIPYLGPLAAGIPPVVDAFITLSPLYALGILGFYFVIMMLEGYIIVPVLMGRSMDLNATTVMLACLFWDLVWGTPGLFLAMPLMSAIKAICTHIPDGQPWANLMSTGRHKPRALYEKEKDALALEKTQVLLPEDVEGMTASPDPK